MRILIGIFTVVWMSLVLIDYSNKHPIHFMAIEQMKLGGFLLSMLVIFGIAILANEKLIKKDVIPKRFINGTLIGLVSIIVGFCSVYFYLDAIEIAATPALFFMPIVHSIINFLAILFFLLSVASIGKTTERITAWDIRDSSKRIIWTGIGLMVLCAEMFVLGLFSFLNAYSLLIVLLIPIILENKFVLKWLKAMFVDSFIAKKALDNKLITLAIAIIGFLTINFLYIQIPFPPGFDSRNYYLNISQLIEQQDGLVRGFQPYNWSLLMSYGFVIFKVPSIAFGISFLGIILSIWAFVEIATSYIKLSLFQALFIAAMFIVTPSVTNQLFVELKVDLGLLFMQLVSIILLMNYYSNNKEQSNKSKMALVILLGLISGFALGIKLTHIYLLFGMMALIWFKELSIKGFFAIFSLIIFIIFISRLDNLSGLSSYHLGVDYYKWGFLIISLVLMSMLFTKNKEAFINTIKISTIITVLTLFTFSPWVIKNYSESTGALSIEKLLIGTNPGPKVNIKTIEDNFEKSLKKNKK